MSDEIKVNRPPQAGVRSQAAVAAAPEPEGGSSKAPWIILAVVVVVIIVLGVLFRDKLFGGSRPATDEQVSDYQAVFLTNGQVYFGTINSIGKEDVVLNDIFYLQVVQPPLQGTPQDPSQQQAQQQQPQISLVKLGNELHGPIDEMHINRQHILFYEDLKEESQVVQAIKQYKANPQGTVPAPQQTPPVQQQTPPPAEDPGN